MIDLVEGEREESSGVGTRNDPPDCDTTRRRWERRHQTLAKY